LLAVNDAKLFAFPTFEHHGTHVMVLAVGLNGHQVFPKVFPMFLFPRIITLVGWNGIALAIAEKPPLDPQCRYFSMSLRAIIGIKEFLHDPAEKNSFRHPRLPIYAPFCHGFEPILKRSPHLASVKWEPCHQRLAGLNNYRLI